jgi:hypothetical protein
MTADYLAQVAQPGPYPYHALGQSEMPDTLIVGMRVGHGVRIQCLLMAKSLKGGARLVYREDLLTAAGQQMFKDMRAWFLADPKNSIQYYSDHAIQDQWRPEYSPEALVRLRMELISHPPRRVIFFEPSTMEEVINHVGDLLDGVDLQYVDPDRRPVNADGADLLDFSTIAQPITVHYPVDARPARLTCRHSAPSLQVRAYGDREFDFVTHGGGWAMGGFREVLDRLSGPAAILLPRDRAMAEKDALLPRASLFFDIDLGNDSSTEFARLAQVTETGYRIFPPMAHHGSLDVISRARAIVSKPGGATLVDSYLAQTPILYLDPISHYEQGNVEFIEQSGIGIRLEDFIAKGADAARLRDCSANLARLVEGVPTLDSLFDTQGFAPVVPRRAAAAGR